ncbi:hypothetical protein BSL78_07774 [Apostichopus japonicus]|uniref:Uncharacterized protein n=1 Tax=Stichopus japonicus TaxID=307972 RepID=A0A2G8L4Y2_STIJA|nr:hypothetical protein BSL78_07774 [Apostichopus japonicus]
MAFCIPLLKKKTATEAVNEITGDDTSSTMTEIGGGSDVANQRRSRDVACPEPTPEDLADIVSNAEDTVEILSEDEELEVWTSLTGLSPYLVDSCNHRDVIANAALNTRTLCPYTYEEQTDTHRYPQTIPQVRCNCTDCYNPNDAHQDNTCRPVFKDIPVLRRGGSEDDSNDPCR